ncbi:two-component regulator propeller domain-containing protein [Aureisphaera galaxeae]|uniref:sensor histidine kinase n=1 Tax=Aureisphaera galaxeae TaxID=1538023 RepID=UPI002350DAB5|nr:two-component regulator propeller domain-containing protein [Aureisphaera galaxeae]MDC8005468.1 two-component regulator propeller domain-containing protein [Aureisphaera galaxeae]
MFFLFLIADQACLAQDYEIRKIPVNLNGESAAIPNKILVDQNNFLWYFTHNGLVRDYSHGNFLFPFQEHRESLNIRHANLVFEDSKGRIWVGTDEGAFVKIDGESALRWVGVAEANIGGINRMTSFLEDSNGNVWAGTTEDYLLKISSDLEVEIIEINHEILEFSDDYTSERFLSVEHITANNEIVFRQSRKLFVLNEDGETEFIFRSDYNSPDHLSFLQTEWNANGGNHLSITKNGEVFEKDRSGSYWFDGTPFQFHYLPKYNLQVAETPYLEMLAVPNELRNKVLGGTDLIAMSVDLKNLLCFRFEKKNGEINLKPSLKIPFENAIEHVDFDINGIVYVSSMGEIHKIRTPNLGFERILTNFGQTDQGLNVSTRGMVEMGNGDLLAATYRGVFRLSGGSLENLFPKLNTFREIVKLDDTNYLGLGDNSRLAKFNVETKEVTYYHYLEHPNTETLAYMDAIWLNDSELLVGSGFGILTFNPSAGLFSQYPFHPDIDKTEEGVRIKDLHIKNGILYVATLQDGFYMKDMTTEEMVYYPPRNSEEPTNLNSIHIYVLKEGPDGNIWMGTGNGIHILRGKEMIPVPQTIEEYLDGKKVVGIQFDEAKNIWFSTYNGLFCYNPSKEVMSTYYVSDGLADNEFNQNSSFKTNDGKLYFGGINGFVAFRGIGDVLPEPPQVYPLKLSYVDKKTKTRVEILEGLSNISEINLSHNRNSLDLEFSINGIYDETAVNYRYMLEGFQEDWTPLGSQNEIKLLSIPPGSYQLKVVGVNSKGIASTNELHYAVNVSQVFYKRTEFIIGGFLFLIAVIVLSFFLYIRNQRRKGNQRLALAELQGRSLITQMSSHFIFNSLHMIKNRIMLGNQEQAEDDILKFAGLVRTTLDFSRNKWIPLSKEIDYITNYIHFHNMEMSKSIRFAINNPNGLNWDELHIPSMLLQPILENSLIHGFGDLQRDGEIQFAIKEMNELEKVMDVVISDNGIGIDSASKNTRKNHTSYGVQILEERLSLLNELNTRRKDKLSLVYKDLRAMGKSGTEVTITIPYRRY